MRNFNKTVMGGMLAATLGLTACGGQGSAEQNPAPASAAPAAGGDIRVTPRTLVTYLSDGSVLTETDITVKGSYNGLSFPIVHSMCQGSDLMEITSIVASYSNYSGSAAGGSESRTANFGPCASDGELTQANFPPPPHAKVVTP